MKKQSINKNLIAAMILLVILFVLFGVWFFLSGGMEKDLENTVKIAKIYQDGKEIYSIPLDEVEESYELEIDGENGAKNIILVEKGQISVTEASCPDKICIKTGPVSNGRIPITCLPNHLLIQIEEAENANDVDITSY